MGEKERLYPEPKVRAAGLTEGILRAAIEVDGNRFRIGKFHPGCLVVTHEAPISG